jgi:hypothetical protein
VDKIREVPFSIQQSHIGEIDQVLLLSAIFLFCFFRRKTFVLHEIIDEKNNFDSVHHHHIKSIEAMINCQYYFPNAMKLTFNDHLDTICDSIGSKLIHIVPLKQITTLSIVSCSFSLMQLNFHLYHLME